MRAGRSQRAAEGRILLVEGDITRLRVDAIVNAANHSLLGGGGVDGAIHRAAGPRLLEECRTLVGCEAGDAKITAGYNLAARHVIHTVGPVWRGGGHGEDELLASCYRHSLALAAEHLLETTAFPAISTGVYGFPRNRAAQIAVREVDRFLRASDLPRQVVLVAYTAGAYEALARALREVCPLSGDSPPDTGGM